MGVVLENKIKKIRSKFTAKGKREFDLAIASIVDNVSMRRFVKAIEARNIGQAISILDMDKTTTARLAETFGSAFNEVGSVVASGTVWRDIEANRVIVRWDMTNPRAARFLELQSSREVQSVTEKTKDVIARVMRQGFEEGRGPRSIALDVVGRIGANGRRSGGVVGLNGPQAEAVRNMRRRLESGNISDVKTMSKRDRRFDAALDRHIANGTRPTRKEITKYTTRYSARLLKLRGDTIARTETGASVLGARHEAHKQWQQKTGVSDQFVVKTWDHTGGGRKSRDKTHLPFDGTKVRGLDTVFNVPTKVGTVQMLHPLDSSLGAGASDIINCTCDVRIRIDHAGILKAAKGG